MREIAVRNSIIDLFIESFCDTMEIEPQRIKNINNIEFIDTKTNVSISLEEQHNNKKDQWLINLPNQMSFILNNEQIEKINKALNGRENCLLLEQHRELYHGENIYKKFKAIQELRKKSSMVEDAYQNLLTIYALNIDGDDNVS